MENLSQHMSAISDSRDGANLSKVLSGVYNRLRSASLSSAGLVIKASDSPLAKTGSAAWYAMAKGTLITKAAGTDMPALSGTVANAAFNVYVFSVDSDGTMTTTMGTAGSSLAAVKFPTINDDDCVIGFVIINPTGTGDFVGGTTALDDSTVTPGTIYVSPLGAMALKADV